MGATSTQAPIEPVVAHVRAAEVPTTSRSVEPPAQLAPFAPTSPESITLHLPSWVLPARAWLQSHRQLLAGLAIAAGFLLLWFRPHPAVSALPSPPASATLSPPVNVPSPASPLAAPGLASTLPSLAAPPTPALVTGGAGLPATIIAPAAPLLATAPVMTAPALFVPSSSPLPASTRLPAEASASPVENMASLRAADAAELAASSTSAPVGTASAGPAQLQITTVPPGIPFRVREAYERRVPSSPLAGTSPALVEDLPLGVYRVEFAADGLGERSSVVRLEKAGMTPLDLTFPHGTLKVLSKPAGAEIFCDEQSLGPAPLEVPLLPGAHVIRAENEERDARPRTVTIAADNTQPLSFDFTDAPKRTEAATARRRSRPKKPEPNALTKIGRSITNLFGGSDKKK